MGHMGDTFLCVYGNGPLQSTCTVYIHTYIEHAFICTYACMRVHVCLCVCSVCAFMHTVGVCQCVYVLCSACTYVVWSKCELSVRNLICDALCGVIVATSGSAGCALMTCLHYCLSVTFPAVHEGGRDRRGGAIIIVRVDDKVDLGPLEVGKALLYLNQVPE